MVKKSNFLKDRIIEMTKSVLSDKKLLTKSDILYFENDIRCNCYNGTVVIDSIAILPNGTKGFGSILWDDIDAKSILKMKDLLSQHKFFFYRQVNIDGKYQRSKCRLKVV